MGLATALGTSGELALSLGAELLGCADVVLGEIESLDQAGPASLSFVRDQKYLSQWSKSACGAALVTRSVIEGEGGPDVPAGRALIVVEDADQAMVTVLGRLSEQTSVAMGIAESASIDASATIGEGVAIAPGVVIGPGSCIGDRCEIRSGCMIGAHVKIGADCLLHPSVVVQDRCELGERCIMQPGVAIGGDGFGFVPALDGKGLTKIPHIGNVVIGNDVEIGANSCVDRAKFGSTLIGDGTKIDNLVQIGHGCRLGRACIICGLVGIAGSANVGDGVVIAGLVGVADNTTIGAGATIAARSGVTKNVPAGETWLGFPARPSKERMQQWAALEKLPDMMRDIRRMLKTDSAGR